MMKKIDELIEKDKEHTGNKNDNLKDALENPIQEINYVFDTGDIDENKEKIKELKILNNLYEKDY